MRTQAVFEKRSKPLPKQLLHRAAVSYVPSFASVSDYYFTTDVKIVQISAHFLVVVVVVVFFINFLTPHFLHSTTRTPIFHLNGKKVLPRKVLAILERFSLDCRKTKTKVNALANQRA